MSFEASIPQNTVALRQLQGMRREMMELVERQGRIIELVNRLAMRMDEGFTSLRQDTGALNRDVSVIRSDLVLMENKILDGQSNILRIVARLDDEGGDPDQA
ncbi:hypothetical protein [Methylobacterium oryzisoli]|uniref:hypothetical protein n=1 Tax=Methylobacterium oryzisoli TaxID=3385502 RepID=UPI003892A040